MDNELVPYEEPKDEVAIRKAEIEALANFDIESMPEPTLEKVKWGRKSTNFEYQNRLNEALELVLYKNLSQMEFRLTYSKMYKVSERTADKVWSKVKLILKERFEAKTEEIVSNQVARYMDLLERAREDGNKRVERETLWDISRILGLDQRKIDISSGGMPIDIKINLSNNPKDFNNG
jgi:hypothetical protein